MKLASFLYFKILRVPGWPEACHCSDVATGVLFAGQ
jgi:hypothetical protein